MHKWIGLPELLVLLGLIMLAGGLWMTIGWWSAVICGIIIMSGGVFLANRGV